MMVEQQIRPLASFFNDHRGCVVVRKDRNKLLLRSRASSSHNADLFVKIYLHPNLRSRVQASFRLAGGARELYVCRRLRSLSVLTPEPIGCALKRSWFGLPLHSLYAARWISDAVTLQDLIFHEYDGEETRNELFGNLVVAIGHYIATLNKKGVVPRELNAGNLLVRRLDSRSFEFILVDYDRVSFSRRAPLSKCLTALSQVGAFLVPVAGDVPRQLSLGYTQVYQGLDLKALTREVDLSISRRRKLWARGLDEKFSNIAKALRSHLKTSDRVRGQGGGR